MIPKHLMIAVAAIGLICTSATAATFVVPTDRDMVRRAQGVVVATALPSYSQMSPEGGIETVTPVAVDEWIKGRGASRIDVVEPGGSLDGVTTAIPGAPRFNAGDRLLLLIVSIGDDRWAVAELVLGKFTFANDTEGAAVLVRDEDEIVGWDPDLKMHVERRRSASRFLDYVRKESAGEPGDPNYWVEKRPLAAAKTASRQNGPTTMIAPYTATSYTIIVSGSMGSRWTTFPSAVPFYTGTTTEPGAPNGGVTAVTTAFNSWNGDCPSNVNYTYAGVDDGTHTQGLHAPDGRNTILFERDLSSWGIAPFSCSSSGYSGTLGIGGVTSASGTNTLNGETFMTTLEADVEMNRGIANCTLLFNNGDFNSAVTHEVGHTLGFRHSDQTRSGSAACSTDPSLECSSSAIMTAFVTTGLNAALQAWDQHAVQAVYPGGSCTTCTAPAVTRNPASTTITAGQSVTLSVAASGTTPLSYQWYIGTSGSGTPIAGGTGGSITVSPSSTTSYWVKVSNSCGSVNSATATVTVNASSPPPAPKRAPMDFDGDGHSDLLWFDYNTGWVNIWFMNGRTVLSTGNVAQQTDPNWHIVGIGDFNADGKSDILWWNSSTTMVQMWEMSGRGILNGNNVVMSGDPNWRVEAIGDFYGDGYSEVIWRNQSTGSVAMWDLRGHTFINGAPIGSTGDPAWHIEAAADFNGDGKADLVFRNVNTGAVAMWTMNGRQILNSAVFGSTGDPSWRIEGAGDFNGDGYADLLLRNYSNGTVAMWEMRDRTILNGAAVTPQPDFNWQAVAIGDFEADHTSDIIWWNAGSGVTAMWNMQGHTILNGNAFTTMPINWKIQPLRNFAGPIMSAE